MPCLCNHEYARHWGVALLVAQTKATRELTIDGQALGAKLAWVAVPGSEFSAEVDPGTTDKMHTAKAPTSSGLLPFRLVQAAGYGTRAACGRRE